MPVDPPIRANGGAQGFGIEIKDAIKTSRTADGRLRVAPDPPLAEIKTVEIWVGGALTHKTTIQGEWEILFLP